MIKIINNIFSYFSYNIYLRTANEIYNLGQNTPLMSLEGILHRSNLLNSDRFFSHYLEKSVIHNNYSVCGPIGLSTHFQFFVLLFQLVLNSPQVIQPKNGGLGYGSGLRGRGREQHEISSTQRGGDSLKSTVPNLLTRLM